jgi:hypothetical protein
LVSQSPLDDIDNEKHKVFNLNPQPMKHSWKTKCQGKAEECHLEEGKTVKPENSTKSGKPGKMAKKELRKAQNHKTPPEIRSPNILNADSPPKIDIIMFLLSITRLARVELTLCTISPPLTMNSLNTIREKNEMICMRSKLGCFTRYTNMYVSNYTQLLCQDL